MHIPENHVLLIRGGGGMSVSFKNKIIRPFQKAGLIDISPRTITMKYFPPKGLLTKDFRIMHMAVKYTFQVIKTADAITSLAQRLNIEKVSDIAFLKELFQPLTNEMLKAVIRRHDASAVIADQTIVQNELIREISRNLNGFTLDHVYMNQISISDEVIDRKEYLLNVDT